ncbi:hypothetical protein WDV06_36925, partial [Streptomyces racemochromogenes]
AAMSAEHPDHVTVTHGMRGWFAVYMKWTDECGGFYEPWQSHDFSHSSRAGAESDARAWAEAEEVEVRL